MRSHRWRSSLCALVVLSVPGCQVPARTPMPPAGGDVCDGLAYVFYLVARNKDEGDTREEQLEKAASGVSNPFSAHPERTLRYWEQVIEFVYRRRDADAVEIRRLAREGCSVRNGRAVLLWPRGDEL